uniref:Uncharacterized protein n=1 Tax=Anguilla anguilla TaxID=7936 RepID=A0A0E9U801_ANGAN
MLKDSLKTAVQQLTSLNRGNEENGCTGNSDK